MDVTHIDKSRIEKYFLKENYLLLLGFPGADRGEVYVPLRVIAREYFEFMYDPIQEGQISTKVPAGSGANGISDLGFISPTRLGSVFLTGKPFNAFYIKDTDQVYQMFFGISPSALRIFLEAPSSTGQRDLDIDRWANSKLQFGYIDGFDSPLLYPSPESELMIPPQFDFSLGYGNPLPEAVSPLLLFLVNRLKVALVLDVQLVERMLAGSVPVAIKTVGGLSTYTYNIPNVYQIQGIPLDASRQEIAAALNVPLTASSATPAASQRRGIGPLVRYP
jgi:hypothetical protein